MTNTATSLDTETAEAFATSWNNLPSGSVYTFDQFQDWFEPITKKDVENKTVLELGCGNGSLLVHMTKWEPAKLTGVDLGSSVLSAETNLKNINFQNVQVVKDDLTTHKSNGYDLVYCIGVLHHLKNPKLGFDSVVRNTKEGGRFHCWVYAHEGNAVVRYIVDPIRKLVSNLPWWATKYLVATPLVIPYFIYAKLISNFDNSFVKSLPLYSYSKWISKRGFLFFRHVAFDQLVTPQTAYIKKQEIENWLNSSDRIDQSSTYIIFRNGNSWKFGGKIK